MSEPQVHSPDHPANERFLDFAHSELVSALKIENHARDFDSKFRVASRNFDSKFRLEIS